MAIVKGTTTEGQSLGTGQTSITFSHNHTGNFLVVRVSLKNNNTPSSVTYDGVSMTKSIDATYSASVEFKNTVWTLLTTNTGSHNVVINCSSSGYQNYYAATSFSGVHTTSPVDVTGFIVDVDAGTSISKSVTTNYDNSFLLDSLSLSNNNDWSAGLGQTIDFNQGDGNYRTKGSYKTTTTAGSQTMSWSGGAANGILLILAIREVVTIVAPTVTTQAASSITTTSCTGNGNITATGGANATRRGFCYKAASSGDPTTSDSTAYDDGSFGTGAYTKSVSGLSAGTNYRVRAYAVNSAGTAYGTTVDVKTIFAESLTESVKAVPSFAGGMQYIKTLTQAIVAISSAILLTGKTLLETINAIGLMIKESTIYKVLTQSISINDVLSGAGTFFKALTETIKSTSESLKETGKMFVETVLAIPSILIITSKNLIETINITEAFDKVLAAVKTLTETILAIPTVIKISTFFKSLGESIKLVNPEIDIKSIVSRGFNETIKVIGIVQDFVMTKVLGETIKAVSSFYTQGIKLFEEIIIAIPEHARSITAYRTLEETIIAISDKAVQLSKTMVENIKAVSLLVFLRMKTMTEEIKAIQVFNSTLLAYKTLIENIKVSATQILKPVIVFIENISVNIVSFFTRTTKQLKETIKASSSVVPMHIFFKVLSDSVIAIAQVIKSSPKVLSEFIKSIDVIGKSSPRVLDENITSTDTVEPQWGVVLWERVNAVSSFIVNSISKVLSETVKVVGTVSNGAAYIFSETINALADVIPTGTKILVESIKAIGEMAGNAMARILKETIKFVDTVIRRKTYYKTVSDRIVVVANVINRGILVLTDSIVAIAFIIPDTVKVLIEKVKIAVSFIKVSSLHTIYMENVAVGANVFNQGLKTLSETVSATSEFILGTISKVLEEIIVVRDVILKSLPKTLQETVYAVSGVFSQGQRILTETITITGSFILGTISKLLTEVIKPIQIFSRQIVAYKEFNEIVNVIANGFTQGILLLVETITATGSFILGTISKVLVEIIKPIETITKSLPKTFTEVVKVGSNIYNQAGKIFSEAIAIIDVFGNFVIGKLLKETISVVDNIIKTLSTILTDSINVIDDLIRSLPKIISETISVISNAVSSTGRTFNEAVALGRDKIKLVLNGIEVGLWKIIPRISGIWKKISRNDTLK